MSGLDELTRDELVELVLKLHETMRVQARQIEVTAFRRVIRDYPNGPYVGLCRSFLVSLLQRVGSGARQLVGVQGQDFRPPLAKKLVWGAKPSPGEGCNELDRQ